MNSYNKPLPEYRKHGCRSVAAVTIDGVDFELGRYGSAAIGFQDLLDHRQERFQLPLRPRLPLPITGRLGMRQNLLQRVPAQMVLLAGRTLTQLARQHLPTNLFPKLHVA